MQEIAGILCDFDGTLVDSERHHLEAWNRLVERHGQTPIPHWNDDCIGLPDSHARDKAVALYPDLAGIGDLLEQKQEWYRRLAVANGPDLVYPGVPEALMEVARTGVRLALGTNSIHRNTQAVLRATGLERYFQCVVTLDRVRHGKPAPDIYLAAAAGLGLPPDRCAVLEDSAAGVQAGKAAGCLVLGVLNTWPAARLAGADRLFDDTPSALAWALAEKVRHA